MSERSSRDKAIDFVLRARTAGRTDDEIRWSLIGCGWSKEAVDALWQHLTSTAAARAEPIDSAKQANGRAKCPRCGATVFSTDTTCLECGLRLRRTLRLHTRQHEWSGQIGRVVMEQEKDSDAQSPPQSAQQERPPTSPQTGQHLNTCIHCGQGISPDAEACPHCGARLVAMSTSDWRYWAGCSGCGCQWWLALILLGGLAEAELFEGAGTVVVWIGIIGIVLLALDTLLKKATGRSLIERMRNH